VPYEAPPLRILFAGTPEFALPSLERLHASGHDVVLVLTRPDARRGRGLHAAAPPVKEAALQLGLEVYQPQSINLPEALERAAEAAPNLGVVVAYGEILGRRALAVPPGGCLNVHASLLPKYRGAAPINWALIRGEKETGVTVQRMAPRMDAGPVLAQRSAPIGAEETAGELHDRLSLLAAEALVEVVDALADGTAPQPRPQDPALATLAPKLTAADRRIDWSLPAERIHNLVRGLAPHPGALARFTGARRAPEAVTVLRAWPALAGDHPAQPVGTVIEADERSGIVVQAGDGAVALLRLKPASGKEMDAGDFIHGRRVESGDLFE